MRYIVLVLGLLLALGGLQVAMADGGAKDRPHCENCGMFTDKSATRTIASVTVDGKTADHQFVCLECVFEKLEKWGDDHAKLKGIKTLDFATFGTDKEKLVDVNDAWFLYDTGKLKGSMPKYTAAFSSKAAAQKAQKELGGTLMQWSELKPKLQQAD